MLLELLKLDQLPLLLRWVLLILRVQLLRWVLLILQVQLLLRVQFLLQVLLLLEGQLRQLGRVGLWGRLHRLALEIHLRQTLLAQLLLLGRLGL